MKIFVNRVLDPVEQEGGYVELAPGLIDSLGFGSFGVNGCVIFDEQVANVYRNAFRGLRDVSLNVSAGLYTASVQGDNLLFNDFMRWYHGVRFYVKNVQVYEFRRSVRRFPVPDCISDHPFFNIFRWPEVEKEEVLTWSPEQWKKFFTRRIEEEVSKLVDEYQREIDGRLDIVAVSNEISQKP